MDGIDWGSIGLAAGALVYGVWQSFKSKGKRKAEDEAKDLQRALDGKEELIAISREQAAAWKVRYESEHDEYVKYRQERHEKDGEIQSLVLRLTMENAELRAKTDLSPVLEHQRQNAEVQVKMLESLAKISAVLDVMLKHVGAPVAEGNL